MNKKRLETISFSIVGVIAMFIIVVAVNFIGSLAKQRIDMTADKSYTLSAGTKAILAKLDGPVEIHLYVSRKAKEMPVALKTYADRVEDLLNEYQQYSKGHLTIKKYDPEPDSDAEDKANIDGVEGQLINTGDKLYLGLAVTLLDQKQSLPFLSPDRERQLEYDVSRAIANVLTTEKPTVGVMSSLPVFGRPSNPMMAQMGQQPQDPWVVIQQLQQDYTVEQVDSSADKIDDKIKVLVVIHPKNISDKTQYALDQFVLRGGKLIAFIDPLAIVDRSNANPMMGGMGGGSSLDKLMKAWGLAMEPGKVVADMNYTSRVFRGNKPENIPAFLSLTKEAINTNDVTTAQLDNLLLPFAGAITGTPAEGLKEDVLLSSSTNSQMVEGFLAQLSGEQITKDFKASGKQFAMAVRLTGKFKTAYPDGAPEDKTPPEEKKDEKAAPKKAENSLKQSAAENSVILVADADMLYDQFSVQVQDIFGQHIVIPRNGNLNFVQNMIELMSGDSNLIAVRSRATVNRPFTVINKMQAEAEARYQSKIKELETSLQDTQQKLNELQKNKEKGQRFILSPEQQKEVEDFRKKETDVKAQLKEERKKLQHDIDALENEIKWSNILIMPALVALTGLGLAFFKRKYTAAR